MNEKLKSTISTKQVYICPLKKYSLAEINFHQLPFYAILITTQLNKSANLIISLYWFPACYRCWLSLAINFLAMKFPKGCSCFNDKKWLYLWSGSNINGSNAIFCRSMNERRKKPVSTKQLFRSNYFIMNMINEFS